MNVNLYHAEENRYAKSKRRQYDVDLKLSIVYNLSVKNEHLYEIFSRVALQ